MTNDIREAVYDLEAEHQRKLNWLERDQRIIPENKQLIKDFLNDKRSEGISTTRASIILIHLRRSAWLIAKPLSQLNEKDLRQLMAAMEGQKWSDWTKNTCRILIKELLVKHGWQRQQLEWIKNKRPANKIMPEDLITDEEANRLVAAAGSTMWKSIISLLLECGMRPGELLTCQVKHISFNGHKARLSVAGKMEKKQGRRNCYIYRSLPVLKAWIEQHPQRNNPAAPLWITEAGKPLRMIILNHVFKKIAARAKVKTYSAPKKVKRIISGQLTEKVINETHSKAFPYLLRHTALTRFYRDYGAVIGAKLAGHCPGSKEIATYLHLSEQDVEAKLDEANGYAETSKPVELQKCPACQFLNPYAEIFCLKCKVALSSAGAVVQEQEQLPATREALLVAIKELLQDPAIKQQLFNGTDTG